MDESEKVAVESRIKAAFDEGDFSAAATCGLEGYGSELFGYLMAMLKNEENAWDVFSEFSEILWQNLPGFRWESSFRTWAYVVIRHLVLRQLKEPSREIPLSRSPEVDRIIEKARTETPLYLQTEVKDQIAELREQLSPDEQTLFILRLNRGMSWSEIARIMTVDENPDAEQLGKETATIRKRFQRAKTKLGELARQRGLL